MTRILSDIHYADSGSWVQELRALAPLIEGVDRLIVNGDALDTQVTHRADELAAALQGFVKERVAAATFVTGNHDPDISAVHELLLCDDRVWVTHGDVFFDDIAPWSRRAPEIRRRVRAQASQLTPEQFRQIETRFRVFRQACRRLPFDHDPNARGRLARLRRIVSVLSNAKGVAAMLRVWREMPDIALAYAIEQRPSAQVLITGHTHRAGVWRRPQGKIVINTGSFCPPAGGHLVDVFEDRLVVRRILRRGGEFRVGGVTEEIQLAAPGVSAITAGA